MFRAHVLIVRRAKLYYTVSGIITPIGGRPVHRLREMQGQQNIKIRRSVCLAVQAVSLSKIQANLHT